MRHTSYLNLLWVIVLVASFYFAAPAPTLAASYQPNGTPPTSQPMESLSVSHARPGPTDAGRQAGSSTLRAQSTPMRGPAGEQVEKAGILPDSASLLPVAAVVGFSFLLGGIVCGTMKTR